MTNQQSTVLVFKDGAGDYFTLPQATLERGRVAAEHAAEVERLLAASNDVSGHLLAAGIGYGLIFLGSVLIGKGLGADGPLHRDNVGNKV